MLGESLGEYIRDPEEVDARNVAMRLAYNADKRRNTPLPVSAQEYEERKSSRGILFQNTEEDEVRMKHAGSDSWMKAPNGKDTKLTEKQWLQVRTPSFKAWFGDWEKPFRIEKLRASKPVEISGTEIKPDADFKQYKKNALEYGKKLRGTYTNKDTGEKIPLTGGNGSGGIREILQHDYKDAEHLQSVAAIPQIIENGIFIDELANEDKENHKDIKSFRYYVCGLKIGEIEYTVKAVVAVQNNGERYYDHKLTSIEKGKLLDLINGQAADRKALYPEIQKSGSALEIKDTRLREILQVNSSKVVDENGEPLVVYHGTNNSFDTFEAEMLGENTDSNASDEDFAKTAHIGFWVNTGKIGIYSTHKEVFINARNLYVFPSLRALAGEMSYYDSGEQFREEMSEYNDGIMLSSDEEFGGTSFAVFSPEQIKSATENVGTFDPDNPSILFQIIGLSGASGLDLREDSADRAYLRQYSLATAQEMEAAGKDAKAIRLATGWEKGADGKWKYEIPDGKLKGAPLRDEGGVLTAKLGELYDAPELYRAYPELRDVDVRLFEKDYSKRGFVWEGEIGLSGIFLRRGNPEEIARAEARIREIEESAEWKELMRKTFEDTGIPDEELRRAEDEFYASPMGQERVRLYDVLAEKEKEGFYLKPEALPTLVHEIQHMIQGKEGFAKGGNPEMFEQVPTRQKVLAALNEATEGKLLEGGPVETTPEAVFAALGKENSYGTPLIRYYGSGLDSLAQSYGYETVFDLVQDLPDFPESPQKLYRSLAGETEARTAAARVGLGAEARRGTLLAETADVAPEDQLILFQQAYHGSPYGFDSFSTDAIGSGEGMQAFGWGLYFTDNRGIAKGYADKLQKPLVRYKGEDTETAKLRAQGTRTAEEIEAGWISVEEHMLGSIERMARNKLKGTISDYKEHIKNLIESREISLEDELVPEFDKRILRKQIEALRNIDPEQIEVQPATRNLYTVDIPDGDYIKWDGPLTEGQKRKITEQARKEDITDRRGNPFAYEMDGEWVLNMGSNTSGENFYRTDLRHFFPDDKAKSLFLARAGIKGIDYPAGSLSGGAEGRNFVVFDDRDVQVQAHILFQQAQDLTAKIDEVIDAGKRKEHDKTEVEIGEVTDVLAENALLHGYDIRGYKHTLDNYFVQHVMKQHGNQKAETARGNIAITEDDIRRIPDILSAPDFIVYGSTARTGNKAITFIKAEAGSTVFVEEIRTGRKKLAGQTIYKTAGTTDASSIKKIPGLTSENGSDMIRIVDVKNELVNRKTSLLKQNTASPAFASTYRNPNIAQSGGDVNRNLLFQTAPSLLGIHNLSADNIRHALKMGGLANPSVAVINTDIPEGFGNFGEITLIATTPLLDKRTGRNAGIFGADEAWYRTAWELARKRKPLPYIRNRAFNQAVQ